MRVAVTGSHGTIGSALIRSLEADGHEALRIVRNDPRDASEIRLGAPLEDVLADVERAPTGGDPH